MTEVISVRFRGGCKTYYFDPRGVQVTAGEHVIVETAQGLEYAQCAEGNHEVPDEQVENALFKSCLGYNAQIVKHYKLKTVEYDPETGKRIREVETLVEARDEVHVAANTAAQMFWLTNRKPETWKYKPEAQDGDEDEGSGVVLLSPVMDNPGPPTEGGANDG